MLLIIQILIAVGAVCILAYPTAAWQFSQTTAGKLAFLGGIIAITASNKWGGMGLGLAFVALLMYEAYVRMPYLPASSARRETFVVAGAEDGEKSASLPAGLGAPQKPLAALGQDPERRATEGWPPRLVCSSADEPMYMGMAVKPEMVPLLFPELGNRAFSNPCKSAKRKRWSPTDNDPYWE